MTLVLGNQAFSIFPEALAILGKPLHAYVAPFSRRSAPDVMSIESEFDLDKLVLPAWAKESPSYNKYTQHSGEQERRGPRDRFDDRGGDRRPRPARRDFSAPGGKGFNPPTERGPGGQRREGGPRREGG